MTTEQGETIINFLWIMTFCAVLTAGMVTVGIGVWLSDRYPRR